MLNKIIFWYEDNIIGKRTYIIAFVGALITLLQQFGVITLTPEQLNGFYAIMAALGLGTLRSAVNGK